MNKNQQGFSVIEIVMVGVIVVLAATVGWLVFDRQKKDTKPAGTNSVASKDEKSVIVPDAERQKVAYQPDELFSADEKAELDKKLIQPYIDYAEQYKDKAGYNPLSSVTISKKSGAEYEKLPSYSKYRYSFNAVLKSGTSGFLYGLNGTIDWWLPQCKDKKCGLTETFKTKYPEIVTSMTAKGYTP